MSLQGESGDPSTDPGRISATAHHREAARNEAIIMAMLLDGDLPGQDVLRAQWAVAVTSSRVFGETDTDAFFRIPPDAPRHDPPVDEFGDVMFWHAEDADDQDGYCLLKIRNGVLHSLHWSFGLGTDPCGLIARIEYINFIDEAPHVLPIPVRNTEKFHEGRALAWQQWHEHVRKGGIHHWTDEDAPDPGFAQLPLERSLLADEIEQRVLAMLLAGEGAGLAELRAQWARAIVTDRIDMPGMAISFIHVPADAPRVAPRVRRVVDVRAKYAGSDAWEQVILVIEHGTLVRLMRICDAVAAELPVLEELSYTSLNDAVPGAEERTADIVEQRDMEGLERLYQLSVENERKVEGVVMVW